jgi:hypothetical protein
LRSPALKVASELKVNQRVNQRITTIYAPALYNEL